MFLFEGIEIKSENIFLLTFYTELQKIYYTNTTYRQLFTRELFYFFKITRVHVLKYKILKYVYSIEKFRLKWNFFTAKYIKCSIILLIDITISRSIILVL